MGITTHVDRLSSLHPCASTFHSSGGGTSSQQMAVKGMRQGIYIDLQLTQIQQEQREIIEGAASILPSLHTGNMRMFFLYELPLILRLTELDPVVYAFVHFLSQQTATAGVSLISDLNSIEISFQVLLRALAPILTTSLSLLIDPISLSCIRLPTRLGVSVIEKLSKRRHPTSNDTEPIPKRQCLNNHSSKTSNNGGGPAKWSNSSVGQFLVDSPENQSVYSRLSNFKKSPYLPVDLFEAPWSSHCPSIDIVDPEIDEQTECEVPKWNQNVGVEFHNVLDSSVPTVRLQIFLCSLRC